MPRQYSALFNYKEGIRIPRVCPVVSLRETEHDFRPIAAQETILHEGKEIYCSQASPATWFIGLTYNYDKNGCLTLVTPISTPVEKDVSTSLRGSLSYHLHCPTLIRHLMKDLCMTRCEGSIFGHTWTTTFTRLCEIVVNAYVISFLRNADHTHSFAQ